MYTFGRRYKERVVVSDGYIPHVGLEPRLEEHPREGLTRITARELPVPQLGKRAPRTIPPHDFSQMYLDLSTAEPTLSAHRQSILLCAGESTTLGMFQI